MKEAMTAEITAKSDNIGQRFMNAGPGVSPPYRPLPAGMGKGSLARCAYFHTAPAYETCQVLSLLSEKLPAFSNSQSAGGPFAFETVTRSSFVPWQRYLEGA